MTDIYKQLQSLTVAGQVVPCVRLGLSYANRLGVYEMSYRDIPEVDSMGLGNKIYTYDIPFRNHVDPNLPNLATTGLQTFQTNIKNPDGFELIDPVDGKLTVKLKEFSRSGEASGGRCGFDVQVSFIESPAPPKKNQLPNLKSTATSINAELVKLPDSASNIKALRLDEQISVFLSQATMFKDRVIFKIQAEIAKVTRILDLLDLLFDVMPVGDQYLFYPLQQYCHVYFNAGNQILDKQVFIARPIKFYITKASHNLISLAGILNNKPEELLELNPNVGKVLEIGKGAQVYYYA